MSEIEKSVYIVGSLRNPKIPSIGRAFREAGWTAFDDWFAAGPEADDKLWDYEKSRGHTAKQALLNFAAQNVFAFDKKHIDRHAMGLLVLPAGKSGHLELGYMLGQRKPGFILMEGEPERIDVMYNFATAVFYSLDEALYSMDKFVGLPKRN